LKLKTLLVVSLFVLGCSFASAQTFGFASTGGGLDCNFEILFNLGASGLNGLYTGIDDSEVCNGTYSWLSGYAASLPSAGGGPLGSGVTGAGVSLNDTFLAEEDDCTTCSVSLFSKLKANKFNKHTGACSGKPSWIVVFWVSGYPFEAVDGCLSDDLPRTHPDKVIAGKGAFGLDAKIPAKGEFKKHAAPTN
jgi:hypothetical protein